MKKKAWMMGVMGLLIGVSVQALAADDAGVVADNLKAALSPIMEFSTAAIFFTGFMLVGIGSFMIWRLGRHQGMHSPATVFLCLAGIFAGALMVYQSTVVGVGGATLFGDSGGDVTIDGTTQVQ